MSVLPKSERFEKHHIQFFYCKLHNPGLVNVSQNSDLNQNILAAMTCRHKTFNSISHCFIPKPSGLVIVES